MPTPILTRVPLDRINDRAMNAHPGRVLAAMVAGVLFGLGWLTARAASLIWFAALWCGCAVAEGWQEGRRGRSGPR